MCGTSKRIRYHTEFPWVFRTTQGSFNNSNGHGWITVIFCVRWMSWEARRCLLATWKRSLMTTTPSSPPGSVLDFLLLHWIAYTLGSVPVRICMSFQGFGPPGSVIICGDPDPSHQQARQLWKTLISTVLWLPSNFLSLKTDPVNVPTVSNKQKKLILVGILKANALCRFESVSVIQWYGSWSLSKRNGHGTFTSMSKLSFLFAYGMVSNKFRTKSNRLANSMYFRLL